MVDSFVKDQTLLDEKVSDRDFLDFSSSIETLTQKLKMTKGSQMIGVVGAYGVGKSTLIEQIKKNKECSEEWVHFDAWQFPERKELWDGLVLETAKVLNKLEVTRRKVDGTSGKEKKFVMDTAASSIEVATTALSGMPLLLKPLFGLIKNLDYFAENSPARRVFEIQDIFISLINSIGKEKVVFVIEDIDRSGQDGLFFLETFRQFLSKNALKTKVVVIVAISDNSFYQNLDTYLKCLDYVEFFNKKRDIKFDKFVEEVFLAGIDYEKQILSCFLEYIYFKYPDMNMRKIKLILRQADLNYLELSRVGYKPNRIVCIAVAASKYIKVSRSDDGSYFDYFISNRKITAGNEICRVVLVTNERVKFMNRSIVDENNVLLKTEDISLINSKSKLQSSNEYYPSTPFPQNIETFESHGIELALPDFYFNDL